MFRELGQAVGAALVVATLLNGSCAFAKRVGLVQREDYDRYWVDRCGPQGVKPRWLGLGRECVVQRKWSPFDPVKTSLTEYVTAARRAEWPLKAVKDVVVLAMVGLGVVLTLR